MFLKSTFNSAPFFWNYVSLSWCCILKASFHQRLLTGVGECGKISLPAPDRQELSLEWVSIKSKDVFDLKKKKCEWGFKEKYSGKTSSACSSRLRWRWAAQCYVIHHLRDIPEVQATQASKLWPWFLLCGRKGKAHSWLMCLCSYCWMSPWELHLKFGSGGRKVRLQKPPAPDGITSDW